MCNSLLRAFILALLVVQFLKGMKKSKKGNKMLLMGNLYINDSSRLRKISSFTFVYLKK